MEKQGKVWWGQDGNGIPRIKEYLNEAKAGVVPTTWWTYKFAGTNSGAKVELRAILGAGEMFITPKPTELVQRILDLASDPDSLILDSFAGSGTTGHAVLKQNKYDGGTRKFILLEMDTEIAKNVTAERMRKAISGYSLVSTKGKKTPIEGLGDGFRYVTLGDPLFDETGNIRSNVRFADLASHVFFVETGVPLPKRANGKTPLLGIHNNVAIYLLYNGILGDKTPQGGNVLTRAVLELLPLHDGPKVVFGTGCRIGTARLQREQITFRQIPYEIRIE